MPPRRGPSRPRRNSTPRPAGPSADRLLAWLVLLEEGQHAGGFLPGIHGRLFLRGQVGAQLVVQRDHPPCPVAGGVRHGQHVRFGSLCGRLLWRVELDPHDLSRAPAPGRCAATAPLESTQGRLVGPPAWFTSCGIPGHIPSEMLSTGDSPSPAYWCVCVARDHRDPGVRGRFAFHGDGGSGPPTCAAAMAAGVFASPRSARRSPSPACSPLLDQRLQRLLLAGYRPAAPRPN